MDASLDAWTIARGLAGLALLYLGGESLVRSAAALALRLGVSPLAVGLTVVAFATSAPELVVSLDAVLSGANDIAIGNVVGSNICNVALILGLTMLLQPAPVEAKVVRLDTPLMIGGSVLMIGLLLDGRLSRGEGALLLLGLAAYTAFTLLEARRTLAAAGDLGVPIPANGSSVAAGALQLVAGLLLLVAGGHLLVGAAVELATTLGISQATIGLTIVALGTSLPELATSIVASVRRQGDIAVGNLVGSNIFNIFGILGATAAIHPLLLGEITRLDLGTMLAVAVTLLVLFSAPRGPSRIGGGLLIGFYGSYVGWLLVG